MVVHQEVEVAGRSFATFGWLMLGVVWFLAGCAGNQAISETSDSGNRQQLVIVGAKLTDVKGLAMGSARSKGWSIVKSTDDLLVMQRPLDPAALATGTLGAANSTVAPVVEVNATFREQSDGTNVALAATLITQPPGAGSPQRTDYTDQYRDALTQSLQSLRANWTANRQRIANAIPPLATAPEGVPLNTGTGTSNAPPPAQAWGQPAEQPAPKFDPPAPQSTTPTPEPLAFPPAPVPEEPLSQSSSAAPRANPGLPPVVDGSSRSLAGASPTPIDGSTQPPVPAEPQNTMLTLNQGSETGTWAYYAEQYARLRGCDIANGGSQLIQSRADGEIHKVSCVGSDSYLLKCQNGVCQDLAPVKRAPASPQQTKAGAAAAPKTARPEPKTAKADAKAAKAEPKTTKADAKTAKTAPKSDSKTAKAEPKTTKAGAKPAKPEPKTAKAGAKATKTETKPAKADSKAAKSKAKTA